MASSDNDIAALFCTHGASTAGLPPEVVRLANLLGSLHGDINISSESGGYHLNMAAPHLLVRDGRAELSAKHLAVNASKYFGFGEYEDLSDRRKDKCALCMKDHRPYRVSELLNYLPLSQRGFPEMGQAKLVDSINERHEIDDGHGNMIPDHPGAVIPLAKLAPDHAALLYLANREGGPVDIGLMTQMFAASWCESEAPESREIGRWYARRHAGWKDTPQGRIIFNGLINGVRRIWQGRYLEHADATSHWIWHPYQRGWFRDAYRSSPQEDWIYIPPFDQPYLNGAGKEVRWKPAKYVNAFSAQRAEWGILGFDAAVKFNLSRPFSKRFAVLGEGPMDAVRFGPPGVAAIGSYLSMAQAKILASEFPIIVCAQDMDKAGVEARAVAHRMLAAFDVRLFDIEPLPSKDFGAMAPTECWKKLIPLMKDF